jgi:glycosyltransferase involved in cell wall biosynthesis
VRHLFSQCYFCIVRSTPRYAVYSRLNLGGYLSCRLLYVIGELRAGGSERQLYYLIKSIDRVRYRPEVAVWSFKETDTYVSKIRALGVPVHPFPSGSSRATKLIAFRRLVMQIRPQVVHSYSFYTNFAAFWATRGTKAIAIGSVRSDFDWAKKDAGAVLGWLSARWPRRQIFNSSAAAETAQHSKSFFVPKECVVVRNGLDLESFRCLPVPANGKVQILGVGSLFPVKRWDRLALAALALKQRGFDFLIRIVGDGPLHASLKQQAQALGVAKCVEFIGHADDIPGLLAEATILVHTSDNEGCPNAVMEAMACGRAVVGTEVGDVPSLIVDGKTGFVVRPGDNARLVERLATLIVDSNLCRRMGENGRAKAEREFGLDRLVSDTLAVYRAVGWRDSSGCG